MDAIICYKHQRIYIKIKVRRRWKDATPEKISALYTEAVNDIQDSEITLGKCDTCKKEQKEKE